MATTPKIRYDIEAAVSGGGDVRALATQLEGLADTLEGDLKTQALASASALRELGAKQGAIDNFVGLKTEAQAAADRLNAAQLAAQSFAREIAANGTPTRAQTGQLEKLRDAVRESSSEMLQSRRSVEGARDALAQYGVATTSLSAQQRAIKAAVEEQRASFDLLGEAARVSAQERVQAENQASTAAQVAAQKEEAIAAQRQRLIAAVSAANDRAVGQARAAEQARQSAAATALAAERNRAEMIERYNLRESLSQQALLGRLEQVRAQYPRLGAAAQAAGRQQEQAASGARGELGKLSAQLGTLRNIAGAALGGTLVGSLAKDLGEVADSYANVAARVKLATEGSEGFEQGMADVQRISQETNTELAATAGLYATLVRTGKDAGLSAKAAQTEAASLTGIINQSIQLSGASSQAAQAAVTQLVQGLQSGVLRGEEFNSVVEQSPRLARALADGLGVTIGKLREMSKQGELTADVIRKALGGQAKQIQQEFDQLPPTIGRAIQGLSNAWTVYVGETDKATGASRSAAEAIGYLASNLDVIAGLLVDVGQAATAFTALRLAQSFFGIGAAATTAAAGIGAANVAMGTAGASAAATGAAVATTAGRIFAVLGTLRTFTLVGLLVNIKDIGEWLGETAAKLMGYKVATDQMADAERNLGQAVQERMERQKALQAEQALLIERSKGLTLEVKALASEYEQLKKQGTDTGEALRKVAESASLLTAVDTRQFGVFLRSVGADFQATTNAFQAALKGTDLADFERRARAAFGGAKEDVALLEAALNAGLREAVRQSGADFDVLAGGMSEASRKSISATGAIISGLDRLSAQGVDTAAALTASLGKGINTADSRAAFEALRGQVEAVRKVLGDRVADTFLQQIEAKAKAAATEVGGLGDALRQLGITSDKDMQRAADATRRLYEQVRATGGSAREQGEAFRKMAADAVASGNESALAFVRAQAAIQGFEVSTDSAGKTTVRAMNEAADATRGAGKAADGAAGSYGNMAQSAEQAAASAKKIAEINAKYSSPLGTDKYSAPKGGSVTGNTREERLAGQNAVDNSLQFTLRDKLAAGDLTTDDVDELRAVVDALLQREQVDRDVDRMNPAAFSLEGMRDRRSWEQTRQQFQAAISRLGGGSGSAVGRTVNVNLSVGGRTSTVATDADGAQNLVETLRRAGLSAG